MERCKSFDKVQTVRFGTIGCDIPLDSIMLSKVQVAQPVHSALLIQQVNNKKLQRVKTKQLVGVGVLSTGNELTWHLMGQLRIHQGGKFPMSIDHYCWHNSQPMKVAKLLTRETRYYLRQTEKCILG